MGVVSYSSGLATSAGAKGFSLDIGNNGANVSNTVEVPTVSMFGGQVLNVTASNSYALRILKMNTSGGTPVKINPAAGTVVTVYDYGTDPALKPINVGAGSLLFPEVLTLGATATAQNARIKTEIDMLHQAIMQYRNEYGSFPPCVDLPTGAIYKHVQRIFPRMPASNFNAAGAAQTTWTLGPSGGTQTLNVTGPGLTPSPLAITATATGMTEKAMNSVMRDR